MSNPVKDSTKWIPLAFQRNEKVSPTQHFLLSLEQSPITVKWVKNPTCQCKHSVVNTGINPSDAIPISDVTLDELQDDSMLPTNQWMTHIEWPNRKQSIRRVDFSSPRKPAYVLKKPRRCTCEKASPRREILFYFEIIFVIMCRIFINCPFLQSWMIFLWNILCLIFLFWSYILEICSSLLNNNILDILRLLFSKWAVIIFLR